MNNNIYYKFKIYEKQENKKNDRIDNKLLKINFIKVRDSKKSICYERYDKNFDYTHVIEIEHKSNGNHIILSYQKGCNKDGFNNVVGLTFKEIKLLNKKIKKLHWR